MSNSILGDTPDQWHTSRASFSSWLICEERVALIEFRATFGGMTRLQELRKEALSLTDAERAVLASDILQTLPAVLSDEDEGIAEALRRDSELEADPAAGIQWSELKKKIGR